jgi:hypothetical protein
MLNTRQARVQDPILTQHAIGYKSKTYEFIADLVLPPVPVDVRGGQVLTFGKEAFLIHDNNKRAPGSRVLRQEFKFGTQSFAVSQRAMEATVPFEIMDEASQVPGIDLATRAVNIQLDNLMRNKEYDAARVLRNTASYAAGHSATLTGTDQWSHNSADPSVAVDDAKATIRGKIGIEPNTLVLGYNVHRKLRRHPKLIALLGANSVKQLTDEMLRELLGVDRLVVGKVQGMLAGEQTEISDIWGNDAELLYVPPAAESYETPAFGYQYTLRGFPMVEAPYEDKPTRSWVYGVLNEYAPVVSCPEAGFLFKNAVA